MSLKTIFRTSVPIALAALLAFSAGCTVRPLMATDPAVTASAPQTAYSQVAVEPVDTRYGQEVRNHLIFLLNGGAAQPASPRYTMDLAVTRLVASAASVQVATDNEPTAGTITLTGLYQLLDEKTGAVAATGRRQVTSAYDVPRQAYAALRAERDAEDRAARELAEMIRLALGHDLARLSGQ